MLARVALVAVAAHAAACGVPDADATYFGRTDRAEARHLRWCNQGEPDYLDPGRASSTVSTPIVYTLFDGLTTYGPDGLPVPSLATHWETSDDLRVWTFHLRDGATWSNKRAVDAWDVAYAAIRTSHPLTASPNADNIAPLQNVMPYLARTTYRMRVASGPFAAGEIVDVDGDAPPAADLAARASSHALALRDLWGGAPYATVPAGVEVTLIDTTGTSITPPSPDGKLWAYVFYARDAEGVFGWVPADELDREPNAGVRVRVKKVATKRGGAGGDAVAEVRGDQLAYTPDVLGVRVLDAHTIVFTCSDPTPFWLAETDNRALRTAPIEAISRHPTSWTRPENIVTSGPMRLDAWIERDRLELSRSPTYWNQADIKLDRITAFSMDDQAANTNFYFAGGCDAQASNNVPSTYLPVLNGEVRGRPYKDFDTSPYLGVYFLWVNTQKLPNVHLRRALSLAIDRSAIPKFTHGGEIPSAQLTPGTPVGKLSPADRAACGVTEATKGVALVMQAGELCYLPPPGLDFDLARAKEEIAAARAEGGVPAKLHYIYNAGSEAHKQIAEYAQAAWRAIGLDVEVTAQEWNAMLEATRKGDFEIARLGNIGNVADTESEFLPLFVCGSPDNRGRYCSKDYERLLEEARGLSDRRARNAKLAEAERVMLEDAPVIPLYSYTQKHLIKPYVRDYPINLIDQPGLWRVSIDTAWRP